MLSLGTLVLCLSSISLSSLVHASPAHEPHSHFNRNFHKRNYVTPDQRSSSYDYVIIGGGLAGLVLASRLSEDSSKTVLVLEAGPNGDAVPTKLNVPSSTYYDSLLGSAPYDWVYKTVPQPNAGNRNLALPRGKVLGGSSAVNGMYLVRPAKSEVDAWSTLIAPNDKTAAETWNWDNFFPALKEFEIFTPPLPDVQSVAGMKYDPASHGTSGKVHATYPAYMVPISSTWLPSLAGAGIPTSPDTYSGNNLGGMFALTAENPSNWTRSYSKSAYIDPLPPRSNLHIITDATVEKIVFADNVVEGDRVASAVQFSTGAGTPVLSVNVNKEAILCGGTYGSPHVLLLSGVGPKDVLDGAKVPVQNELPGVGQHLSDHLQSVEFNSFVNSGIAYVNGSRLFNGDANFAAFLDGINGALDSSASTLVPSQYSPVVEGYKTVYKTVASNTYPTTGLIEILFSINSPGVVNIQVGLQQPLSRGRVYITSPSVYDPPLIDPQYFSHPADITVMRQAIRLVREIAQQAPLSDSLAGEVRPGADVNSDEDIENFLRGAVGTEYHPAGGCAMLPKDQGGVVDAKLKVYGLSNVRVVDASVFPVTFSAHLMTPTYALAEVAADIIINGNKPTNTGSANNGSTSGTSKPGSTTSGTPDSGASKTGAAVGLVSSSWLGLFVPLLAAFLL
ncbi:GMC oxidoreductase family protein Mala s 12 [Psilocybe cubensis]|uniref:GMC oxidoreductase family protein Mala s 12 n=1 Tax=Psilocybe cubensis TaxID=181762 RepID=A0ACB8GU30_PSICU|nr:GMC oxidoreductase family protein Mala s 12 [Psilocybe cubensis]KAH9479094.1 GMC oxidoreductase family protein Mala s 12 [Psilocybe cubensis]